jgi:hypothetical protein
MIEIPSGVEMRPIEVKQKDEPAYCNLRQGEGVAPDGNPWYYDIKIFLEDRTFPMYATYTK